MPDNITNVRVTQNQWVNLYAETGIPVGTVLHIENIGNLDVYLAAQQAQPAKDHDAYNIVKRPPSVAMQNTEGDLGAWAYCNGGDGLLAISSPSLEGFRPVGSVRLLDGFGNPLDSFDGALDIHDADVHQSPVNELFHRHTGVATTLAVAASAGDTSVTVVDGSGFANGNLFQIESGPVVESTFPQINAGGGTNTFTLDRPLDNDFPIGAILEVVQTNMAVVGSLASPVEFIVIPDDVQEWHAITLTVSMTHTSGSDPSLFGNLAALLNGVEFRIYKGLLGQYRTFTNWKTNYQIGLDFGEIRYEPKVGGGDFGTFATANIKYRSGAIPRLNGTNGDYVVGLVQDDLSVLLTFNMKLQGHRADV